MNVIGKKKCVHHCEADLSAAFGEVIAAMARRAAGHQSHQSHQSFSFHFSYLNL
jgi:hypothetical protein